MSNYTNFAQFVGFFIAGQPLVVKLSKAWSTVAAPEGSTLVILTQPSVRRTLGIAHTPKSVTLQAQDPRIAQLLLLNSATAEAHVAKFDAQAAYRAKAKAAITLVESMGKLLAAGTEV